MSFNVYELVFVYKTQKMFKGKKLLKFFFFLFLEKKLSKSNAKFKKLYFASSYILIRLNIWPKLYVNRFIAELLYGLRVNATRFIARPSSQIRQIVNFKTD